MKNLFQNPATLYRLTDDFYGFKCESKPAILARLKKSNGTAMQIFATLEAAGFSLAKETEEERKEQGVYVKEPLYVIPENRKDEYFSVLGSIDRSGLNSF